MNSILNYLKGLWTRLLWKLGINRPTIKDWHFWAVAQKDGKATVYCDGLLYEKDVTVSVWIGTAILPYGEAHEG
jgi:hypothetical protein